MDEITNKKALSRAIKYLTYRQRSEAELLAYLDRNSFENQVTAYVLKELKRYGYIDDLKYAQDFTRAQQRKGHGIRRIRYELQQKNIDGNIIDEAINEYNDPDKELEMAKSIIEKRKRKSDEEDDKWIKRQVAFLHRRGFDSNIVYKVLKDYNPSE